MQHTKRETCDEHTEGRRMDREGGKRREEGVMNVQRVGGGGGWTEGTEKKKVGWSLPQSLLSCTTSSDWLV